MSTGTATAIASRYPRKRSAPSPTAHQSRWPSSAPGSAARSSGGSARGGANSPCASYAAANASPRRASIAASTPRVRESGSRRAASCEHPQAADTHDLDPQRLRQAARGGNPDAQPGERARPHTHRDPLQGIPADARLRQQLARQRQRLRGVPGALACLGLVVGPQRGPVGKPQPHGGCGRGGVKPKTIIAALLSRSGGGPRRRG